MVMIRNDFNQGNALDRNNQCMAVYNNYMFRRDQFMTERKQYHNSGMKRAHLANIVFNAYNAMMTPDLQRQYTGTMRKLQQF